MTATEPQQGKTDISPSIKGPDAERQKREAEEYGRKLEAEAAARRSGPVQSAQPAGGKRDCASDKVPEKISISGVLNSLDLNKHTLLLEDKDGISHPARWIAGSALDEYMKNQKQGFGETITGILNDGVMEITGAQFFDKKGMPQKQRGNSGGRPYQPRNERPMIYESAFKTCADLVRPGDFEGLSYIERVRGVKAAAGEIAKWMVENGGA